MTNLYFVRHAHSTYSADELNRPLSERGREDARKVTDILKNESINVLISSPYKRAIQTIQGLTGIYDVDIVIEEDFKERLLSDKHLSDFDSAIAKVWEDYSFAWEGGESNIVAQNRGVRALEKVLERYVGKNIAIGTHGNIMVLIMNDLDKRFNFTFWKQLNMPDIYKLSFDNQRLIEVNRIWEKS
ncbi:histidine phosphatase family protein [Paenibacillus yanchengensis]|uniref:Histidine phosphatase family protein n=1 Tax=Paenibacillus yanchengensis TaxID=2035833 RepID=A0ABW4YF74_9BACL